MPEDLGLYQVGPFAFIGSSVAVRNKELQIKRTMPDLYLCSILGRYCSSIFRYLLSPHCFIVLCQFPMEPSDGNLPVLRINM
jgi:hypothetical protein